MGWPSVLVMVRHGESEGNVRNVEERAGYNVPTHGNPSLNPLETHGGIPVIE